MADNKEVEDHMNSLQIGAPHEALFLTLPYHSLLGLLALSEACTSLRDAVNNDVLPWIDLTVNNKPLNSRISDQVLMKYASKANGRMRSLTLINCGKITDDGLLQVVIKNPSITKLYVPGCTGLTPDGIVRAVKTLANHNHNLTSLKISGIYNINKEHLDTLLSVVIANRHFIGFENEKNEPPLDIDVCPRCNQVRLVLQCSYENCTWKKKRGLNECRGCCYCIPRCVDCGKCIVEDEEEVEDAATACGDTLCSECWLKLPKCDFCNVPYCKQHEDSRWMMSCSSGFLCDGCVEVYSATSYD